jgi:hypothetical protein
MDTKKRGIWRKNNFLGGGCDTQNVLPHGSPKDVVNEVKRRIKDLAQVVGLYLFKFIIYKQTPLQKI